MERMRAASFGRRKKQEQETRESRDSAPPSEGELAPKRALAGKEHQHNEPELWEERGGWLRFWMVVGRQ